MNIGEALVGQTSGLFCPVSSHIEAKHLPWTANEQGIDSKASHRSKGLLAQLSRGLPSLDVEVTFSHLG